MAVADIALIIEYLPFVIHQELWPWTKADIVTQYSWEWAAYMVFHANFSIGNHLISWI